MSKSEILAKGVRTMAVEALVRKLVPSTVLIARNPVFSVASRLIDATYGWYAERRTGVTMPPLRYMVRTGVGNNILFPHFCYATAAHKIWQYFFSQGLARLDSHIVDIGSGCGKSAAILRDFQYADTRFSGHYYGFDIDREQVEWCKRHFPKDHFTFSTVDGESVVYPCSGRASSNQSLSVCKDDTIDFVFSQSLFSHLLQEDLKLYLRESYRVLRSGGAMCMTFFCIEDLRDLGLLGKRWTFRNKMGSALVENTAFPEAAVAYEKEVIIDFAKYAGFPSPEVILPAYQSSLLCIKLRQNAPSQAHAHAYFQ
jgi:SAM-dependent methyltransferase